MKKKISLWLMMACMAVFVVSCSESEDQLDQVNEPVETRADSPMLMVSPTEVYFANIEGNGLFKRAFVNVKVSGLPTLGAITRFDCVIQGPGKDSFAVEDFNFSIAELMAALLGQGTDIPVTYYNIGTNEEAELLITATLLGVVAPVQISVPLHGDSEEIDIEE